MTVETIKAYPPSSTPNSWTLFWDMSSGGSTKVEPYETIYIELPWARAVEYFKDRFDRDPDNVTCDCCGEDYSVSSYASFDEASAYHRGDMGLMQSCTIESVEAYEAREDVLVIRQGAVEQ